MRGGLLVQANDRLKALQCIQDVEAYEMLREAWDCIEKALSKQKGLNDLPFILHQTIQHAPEYVTEVMNRFPESIHVHRDRHNRLPIHIALERGMKWSIELTYLLACTIGYASVHYQLSQYQS